jgi:hypothetical protein
MVCAMTGALYLDLSIAELDAMFAEIKASLIAPDSSPACGEGGNRQPRAGQQRPSVAAMTPDSEGFPPMTEEAVE